MPLFRVTPVEIQEKRMESVRSAFRVVEEIGLHTRSRSSRKCEAGVGSSSKFMSVEDAGDWKMTGVQWKDDEGAEEGYDGNPSCSGEAGLDDTPRSSDSGVRSQSSCGWRRALSPAKIAGGSEGE
jgi:hypothetical protein